MKHLGDQVTDFVFGELSSMEIDEMRRHLTDCADCRQAVEQFKHTHAMLKSSPDVEPPRRIIFEVEKRPAPFSWRWLAPVGVAAALIIAVLLAAPIHVQWQDSQMTISFGKPIVPPVQSVQPVQVAAPPSASAAVQPVDYDRIIREVQDSQQSWLVNELKRHDAMQIAEINRLSSAVLYMANEQKILARQGNENAASIQLITAPAASKE
jgi:anti-sigma factor RsiW